MSKEAHTGKKHIHVIKSIFRYNKTIYFLFEIPYKQS